LFVLPKQNQSDGKGRNDNAPHKGKRSGEPFLYGDETVPFTHGLFALCARVPLFLSRIPLLHVAAQYGGILFLDVTAQPNE
jgi:hypothetical protein